MSRRIERLARRASAAPGMPAEVRAETEREILGHLEDSAAEYRSLGFGAREAERLAVRDFGEARKTREDLGRIWRRRPVVLFPDEPGSRLAHFRVYDLKSVLVIIAVVVLLRWQVVAAYHIPTKSMEPTLHGDPAYGDKILVNKLFYRIYDPERWQVAVFEKEGDDRNLIKRIAGLPGERLDIRDGDLYVDGTIARKPRIYQDELLVPVYGDGRDEIDTREERRGLAAWTATGAWREEGGRFLCAPGAGEKASLGWTRPIRDAYPGGDLSFGDQTVGDVVLGFTVDPGEGAEAVGALLREGDACYEVWLPVGEGKPVVLFRDKTPVAESADGALRRGRARHVRFANLDDRVTVEVDGVEILSFDDPAPSVGPVTAAAAEFGAAGGAATFWGVRLDRDIHYVKEGKIPAEVPEGCYFMLGDNSGNSSDSRVWGTVPRDRLIGRPLVVFWPPSRARVIR